MKTSVKKEAHTGEQPIRVLKHNITNRLVDRNKHLIKLLQSDLRLNNYIRYHIANLPLREGQTPYIDDKGVINLHETYLSYVWIVCYYFFVLHEELLVIPDRKKRGLPVLKEYNPELVQVAEDLFNYGKSLIVCYTPWNKDELPNPEFFDEYTDEGWYILRTNDLYVEVLNFILYHEVAHAELEHIKQKAANSLSNQWRKTLEIDADSRAIELLLSNARNSNVSKLAIVTGLASMLFFNKNLDGGTEHPDIDTRLENAINLFSLDDDSSIWSILSLSLIIWDRQFTLGLKQQAEYINYKDLYHDLISQMQKR